jgi:hypothetical protein
MNAYTKMIAAALMAVAAMSGSISKTAPVTPTMQLAGGRLGTKGGAGLVSVENIQLAGGRSGVPGGYGVMADEKLELAGGRSGTSGGYGLSTKGSADLA